jgi:hypothetical protein
LWTTAALGFVRRTALHGVWYGHRWARAVGLDDEQSSRRTSGAVDSAVTADADPLHTAD